MSKMIDTAKWFVREGCDGDPELAIQTIKDLFFCYKCGGCKVEAEQVKLGPKPKKRTTKSTGSPAAFGDQVVCITTVTVQGQELNSGVIYDVAGVAQDGTDVIKYYIKGINRWIDARLFKKVVR